MILTSKANVKNARCLKNNTKENIKRNEDSYTTRLSFLF